ncbi:hypothetical protein KSF73_02295 [Burkholderiaceae bacterium DAT-1]|nr:hypothetical protein [Burkholderiaceae bacterium DAT-1]
MNGMPVPTLQVIHNASSEAPQEVHAAMPLGKYDEIIATNEAFRDITVWLSKLREKDAMNTADIMFLGGFYSEIIKKRAEIISEIAKKRGGKIQSKKTLEALLSAPIEFKIAASSPIHGLMNFTNIKNEHKPRIVTESAIAMEIPRAGAWRGKLGSLYVTRQLVPSAIFSEPDFNTFGITRVFTSHALERWSERAIESHLSRSDQIRSILEVLSNRRKYPAKIVGRTDLRLIYEAIKMPSGIIFMKSSIRFVEDRKGLKFFFLFYVTVLCINQASSKQFRLLKKLGLTEDTWDLQAPNGCFDIHSDPTKYGKRRADF